MAGAMPNPLQKPRVRDLTAYFSDEHGYEAEKIVAGAVVYKKRTRAGAVHRFVVKHVAPIPGMSGDQSERDEGLGDEEDTLRRLWGAEHVVRLLAVVGDAAHGVPKWDVPRRRLRRGLLPWKVRVDPQVHGSLATFPFFVMEYLQRGTM